MLIPDHQTETNFIFNHTTGVIVSDQGALPDLRLAIRRGGTSALHPHIRRAADMVGASQQHAYHSPFLIHDEIRATNPKAKILSKLCFLGREIV